MQVNENILAYKEHYKERREAEQFYGNEIIATTTLASAQAILDDLCIEKQ